MSLARQAKKVVRSGLFRVPRLYQAATSEWRYLLLHRLGRVHEPAFRALPQLVDQDDPLLLDVGANFGQSMLSVLAVLPRARVISFEPHPAPRAALERLSVRFPGVRVEPFGLGEEQGSASLYVPCYNGMRLTALASFDQEAAAGWLSPRTIFGF